MKRLICLLLALCMVLSLGGCGRRSNDFYYDIQTAPVNLDPQSASDHSSQLVISSIFEGLMRVGADGSLEPAAASGYMIADDGLTYRFFLREDGRWSDGSPLTAVDFVYAFRRLFDPATNAPSAGQFFCIKNSEEVHRGRLDTDHLGVEAEDEHTLVIRLKRSNSRFLYLLTTAQAMPCSEDFFLSTRGKYGLSSKTIMGNGPFYLYSWEENALRLRRNAQYEDEAMTAQNVKLNILDRMDDPGDIRTRFLEERTSAAALESLAGLGEEIHRSESENTTWGILFNQNRAPFSERSIRRAMLLSLDLGGGEDALPEGARPAGTIIPHNIRLGEENYRDLAGDALLPACDRETAVAAWRQGMAALGLTQLTGLSVIMPEGAGHETAFGYLAQVWQRDLSLYLTVELLPTAEYERRLAAGDFDLALAALTGSYNSPHAILELFQGHSGNAYAVKDRAYDQLLARAEGEPDLSAALDLYAAAERMLIDEAAFLPLYYQSEYFVMSESVTGVIYDFDSKIVNFQYAEQH
ncbi:MAG: peptide ABC transporter substrate-binding protein [Oscillospiraceae bacterium]|nr:peptide ABC transporter substrate-binding protein [Oscillospiraceae bacterium]